MLPAARITTICWFQRPLLFFFTQPICLPTKLNSFLSSSPPKVSHHCLDEDCNDFLPWLRQKAGGAEISTMLYIGKSTHGRGLFASKSIEFGDCMLKVPFSVQLSPDNLLPDIKSLLGDEVGNVAKLAIVILFEQKLDKDSEWAPYISRLPKTGEMNSTIFWTDDELEMIQKSSLYQETIKKKERIEKDFLAIKPVLCHFPDFFEDVDLEDFKHAYGVVGSRAWGSTRGRSMIPFADFLNHDGTSETCLLHDEGKQISEVSLPPLSVYPISPEFSDTHDDGKDIVKIRSTLWKLYTFVLSTVIADYSYAPGDQVLIRYGKFSNATLLLGFGFTLPHNTHDQVQVEFEIPHHDPLREMKLELLSRHVTPAIEDVNGFISSENFFTIKEVRPATGKGKGIPQALRAFARVLCSTSPQELTDLAMEAAENDGRLARRPLKNTTREVQAHQFLLSRINQLIEEYNTSIMSLRTPHLPHSYGKCALRRQLAIDLLDGERRILRSASDWLKNYLWIRKNDDLPVR
ncbi:hypothetical protein LguiB_029587 [Lonicera macranthoides]